MAAVPFFLKIPARLRDQLDEKIRKAGYGSCFAIAAWLVENGCKISKSAVHRYAHQLKAIDEAQRQQWQQYPHEVQAAFITLAERLFQAFHALHHAQEVMRLSAHARPDSET